MDNWLTCIDHAGVLEWFEGLDDEDKSELIINAIGEKLLGDPLKLLPNSGSASGELRDYFCREEDTENWHSLITGSHISDYGYINSQDLFLELIGDNELMDSLKFDDSAYSEDDLKRDIHQYYNEWRSKCFSAFKRALEN